MRSVLVLFLILLVSFKLAAASGSGILPENQVSPENSREQEAVRLASLLKSGDEEVRIDTIIRLSALRIPAAARALASASSDSSARVRAAAIVGLGNSGDPSFAPIVAARLLEDKIFFVRKSAAYALGKLRTDQSVDALTSALHDKDLEVRGAAAVALGEYESLSPAAIASLTEALSDTSEFVRERSARALGHYGRGSASAVPTLIQLLKGDPGHSVKLQAAISLGEIGDRSALPALENAARDKNPYVSRAATEALKRIAGSK